MKNCPFCQDDISDNYCIKCEIHYYPDLNFYRKAIWHKNEQYDACWAGLTANDKLWFTLWNRNNSILSIPAKNITPDNIKIKLPFLLLFL